uniref:SDE2/SF3A3 SAP domain-containing protein n=1 Tax=Arundo donax TaxID=35708 RepID=A0A0A9D4T7_ARUDO
MDADEGTDTKSVVLDDGNCSNVSSKSEDEKLDLDSVSGSQSEGESSGDKSRHSDSEENGNCAQETVEPTMGSGAEGGNFELDGSAEPEIGMVEQPTSVNDAVNVASEEALKLEEAKADVGNTASATLNQNDPKVPQVEESVNGNKSLHSEPLDLAKYSLAAELEVLGLETLKMELQTRGLKCGGTLQERATRLFLLKTTPLDKIPKKLLAKPIAGGK